MANTNVWTWSPDYNDYYRVDYINGVPQYHFSKQQKQEQHYTPRTPSYPQPSCVPGAQLPYPQQPPFPYQPTPTYSTYTSGPQMQHDSSYRIDQPGTYAAYMPPSLKPYQRAQVPDLIPGTPSKGFYEELDATYMMRTNAREFFRRGKVFSMLHVEAASEDAVKERSHYKDSITVVKFGQCAYSQIRRFIVVAEKQGYCYACPISTYSNRGTLKRGCNPAEHAVVYLQGTEPKRFLGENGMTIDPIAIEPASTDITLEPASRVRLGKVYPIEWNVKVKDLGRVAPDHMGKLVTASAEKNPEVLGTPQV